MSVPKVAACKSPLSLTLDPTGRYAYVACSDASQIAQYTVGADGQLTPMVTPLVSTGASPVSIVAEPKGRMVYTANVSDGSLSEFSIGTDGQLQDRGLFRPSSFWLPYAMVTDRAGQWMYVTDLVNNSVLRYFIEEATGYLNGSPSSGVPTSPGPTAIAIDPASTHLYVLASEALNPFAITPSGGGYWLFPMSPAVVATGQNSTAIAFDASGQRLYSGTTTGILNIYAVDATGALNTATAKTVQVGKSVGGIAIWH
jgi:DNA-binding beta-propeller fold protein YncE